MLLCWSASAAPELKIYEFGKKSPVSETKLTGKPQDINGSDWSCRVTRKAGKIPVWELKFSSRQHEPVRLMVKFISPLNFKPAVFWDGAREHRIEKPVMEKKEFLETFPLAVVTDDSKGLALGFSPDNVLSDFRRVLTARDLSLETRIVVDDRREQKLSIVEYGFTPDFGWRNAVEDYQNTFRSWFVPAPGVDQRIYGISGYLSGAHLQRPFELHSARFSGIRWEWTYAPWFESGFWYPAGDGWRTEKNEYRNYSRIRGPKMLTRDEYDKAVRREMIYGNKAAALFYYILVKDIHQNLAKDHPDAVHGGSGLHSLPSNRGKTKSVFAPGSKIFGYLKNQLRQVVENYEVSGFSFDMANSSYHFTTPSQLEYAVGRSWYDDGKIYTSDTVAPIPFSDYIHTLKRNGKTMGTIFNAALGEFSPFTFFHCDGAIMEGPPNYHVAMILPLRLIMGRKPVTFWHGNPGNSGGIRTARLANDPIRKEQIAAASRQFYLLKSYEFGFNLMNWVAKESFYRPHWPVLEALSEAGYHPVPAIRGADPFWFGRFGDGVGTILTFSNPKRTKISRRIRVVNHYLGKGRYAFLPGKGTLDQQFINGETVFDLTLEPKEVIALRTVSVGGDISGLKVTADGRNISFEADGRFDFELRNTDFYGQQIPGGKDGVFAGKADKKVKLTMLPACGIFADVSAMTALLAPENTPVVEAGAGTDTQIAAEMTAIYRPHVAASIRFCHAVNNREPGFMDGSLAKPDLAVVGPGKAGNGKKICVGTPADFPKFKVPENFPGPFLAMPDPDTLWIGGRTPEEVRKAAYVYFSLLDNEQKPMEKVDFKRPSGWGQAAFVKGGGQKYLQIAGDPEKKNNSWRYAWYPLTGVKGGDRIRFAISCKAEKISSGKIQVGIYEFSDEQARKSLQFKPLEIKAAPGWQTVSGTVKLHPRTRTARFYFLCRNLGRGDIFQVRSFEWIDLNK